MSAGRRIGAWIALLSALGVAGLVAGDLTRTAPGPLSAVHGRIASLRGGLGSCARCHGGWTSTMTESCLECHEPIAAQLAGARGLHGALEPERAKICALCHSEHHGEGFAPLNRRSFALAGIGDRDGFDHDLVGWRMAGKHLELACRECHPNADKPVLEEGERRFLGLQRDCATCHEDPHRGRMPGACADCHRQESFEELHARGHERHLALEGGHGGLSCRRCHQVETAHALEALGDGARASARACASCHEDPHRKSFVRGVAALEERSVAAVCGVCHRADHRSFTETGLEKSLETRPDRHACSGFALQPPHDVQCGACHDPRAADFAARYPGRAPDACERCHADAHRGALARPAAGSPGGLVTRCARCHAGESFSHVPPDRFDHARETGFALRGAHAQAACESCHPRTEHADAAGRTFGFVRERFGEVRGCVTCHRDPHEGVFDREDRETPGKGCARCHGDVSFRVLRAPFDHGRWTGFPLDGAHAAASCAACHEPLDAPEPSGRTWGRAAGSTCGACHADPHGGQFARGRGGKTDCRRCHRSAAAFSVLSFRHDLDARFKLGEAHGKLPCAACHRSVGRGDQRMVRYRPLRRDCAGCHARQSDPLRRRGGRR